LIGYIYGFFNKLTLAFVVLLIMIGVLLTNKNVVPFLAKMYLTDYNITYSSIEGRLINGVRVYDLSYANGVKAKKIGLSYNLLNLLKRTPELSSLELDSLYLDIDKLPLRDANSSESGFFSFAVKNFAIGNSQVLYDKKLYSFDTNGVKLLYDEKLDIEKLKLNLKTGDANLDLQGYIKQNQLVAEADVYLSEKTKNEYLDFISEVPEVLRLKLQADIEKIDLQAKLKSLGLKSDENLNLENIHLSLNYANNHLNADAVYDIIYDKNRFKARQKVSLNEDLQYTTDAKIEIKYTALKLPFENLHLACKGDVDKISCNVDTQNIELSMKSLDYKNYNIQTKSQELALSFLQDLPKEFEGEKISFVSSTKLSVNPFSIEGSLEADSNFATVDALFSFDTNVSDYIADIKLKEENPFYAKYPIKKFSSINLHYKQTLEQDLFTLSANHLNILLNQNQNKLKGFAKLGSTEFFIDGLFDNNKISMDVNTKITSLKDLLDELEMEHNELEYDGEITIQSSVEFDESFSIVSKISIPYYVIKTQTKEVHTLEDISLVLAYKNDSVKIDSYKARYKEHSIYSDKASKISIKPNGVIDIEELWVYDNLLIKGLLVPDKKALYLDVKSDKFEYVGKEAKLTLMSDLKIKVEEGKEYIEGKISLLDGKVFYMPQNDYSSIDKDIIVIQEMKKQEKSNRYINVTIDSKKALKYKVDNIDLVFRPNLNFIQEFHQDPKLYGVIEIEKGKVSGAGKEFSFDKSEIYFAGEDPINPQLNLNLHYYTLDYIDIEIYITNTLASPLVLFSSNPAMSQDDIISYILFGEKASTLFESSDESTKISVGSLVLGTGLKEIFNQSAGVQVDTFNILTNKEGTLGYEIGTRFNKHIRVVYKSDTISSVILQYSLSNSTRIDVDVHETGQGVSFIYLKDF